MDVQEGVSRRPQDGCRSAVIVTPVSEVSSQQAVPSTPLAATRASAEASAEVIARAVLISSRGLARDRETSSAGLAAATIRPLEEDRHALAERGGLLHGVRAQEDREPGGAKPQDQRVELPAGGHVQAGRRLVEHDQARAVDEGERKLEALALAAGERIKRGVCLAREAEAADQLVHGGVIAVERGEEVRAPRGA